MAGNIYGKYTKYYDRLTKWQKRESDFVRKMVKKHGKNDGKDMIVFACGTGLHDKYLKRHFSILGVDMSHGMLKVAKKKNPSVVYKKGDMRTFNAGKQFDTAICLDSIWYNRSYKDLEKTLRNFHRHLKKDGVAIFSLYPWKHNFKQNDININKHSDKDVDVVLFTIEHDPDPKDTTHESVFIFLTRKNGKLKVETEKHIVGLFEFPKVKKLLSDIGFETHLYEIDFSGKKYHQDPAIFVCVKK